MLIASCNCQLPRLREGKDEGCYCHSANALAVRWLGYPREYPR